MEERGISVAKFFMQKIYSQVNVAHLIVFILGII